MATSGHQFEAPSATVIAKNQLLDGFAADISSMPSKGKMNEDQHEGDCPHTMYVKMVSAEGEEFIMKREHALLSGTIRTMLTSEGQFLENQTNVVHLRDMPSNVLQAVCAYLEYKARYDNSTTEAPGFKIEPQLALKLLMAAHFLEC